MKKLIALMLMWSVTAVWAGDSVDCVYRPKSSQANPPASTKEYKDCGTNVDGKVSLARKHLRRIDYDAYGLATVFVQGQCYYVKSDGSMLRVIALDNWADDYSEGLVRSAIDGKIAYYDRHFKQVLPPKYDWASPFQGGTALVCTGCKTEAPDAEGHVLITGGVWGYINKKGEETVPVKYTRKEAERMIAIRR